MVVEIDPGRTPSLLQRLLLRLLLVLVAVSVVCALIAVLRGEPLGPTLSKILTTTFGAGLYAGLALACADCAEKKPTAYAFLGAAAAGACVVLFFAGVWFGQAQYPWWWRALLIFTVHAIALWRCARLMLSPLVGMGAVVVRLTIGATLAIAALTSMLVMRDRQPDPMLIRALNAAWIVSVGGHVAVALYERLQRNTRSGDRDD
jgi:hypothetical protein